MTRRLCLAATVLLLVGGLVFWFHVVEPILRHKEFCRNVRADLKSLATKRPPNISRKQWENVVAWTLNAEANCLTGHGEFAGCPGQHGQAEPVLSWGGDLGTDHGSTVGDIVCHAEHLSGPVRGGSWHCQVSRGGEQLFHTAESGVQPRNGKAAWWVCEVVVCAARTNAWVPSAASYPGAG
ncbi:MAG: hypothetical protein K8U57_01840 [Planctomycetes bacterium]|nr:hypothetical protein [Planctomycetota bacterium]